MEIDLAKECEVLKLPAFQSKCDSRKCSAEHWDAASSSAVLGLISHEAP